MRSRSRKRTRPFKQDALIVDHTLNERIKALKASKQVTKRIITEDSPTRDILRQNMMEEN